MLERATACLKSGAARESLKSVCRVPRSKRMLHSTFWDHGAGDLELPPWAVLPFPMPSDLPLKHNNTPSRWRQGSEKSMQTEFFKNSNTSSEGVFLDFLYPPQALAWLQRAKLQQWQRWERRNARRLPEGFVVASRGYASRSHVQDMVGKMARTEDHLSGSIVGTESEENENHWHAERGEYGQTYEEEAQEQKDDAQQLSQRPESKRAESDATVAYSPNWQNESSSQEDHAKKALNVARDLDSQSGSSSEPGFSDSPSDLAEGVPLSLSTEDSLSHSAEPADAMQSLRKIIMLSRSSPAKNGAEAVERAMSIYDALDEERKNDVRLRRELMEWLSVQENGRAHARCIELYNSIPTSERTLQTYDAALSVLMARKRFELVSKLHEEALQNLENGHQISRTLFRRAVESRHWQVAIQAEKAHHERYQAQQSDATASQIRIFWLHISEMPQLLRKAIELVKYLGNAEISGVLDNHTRQFAAAFFKEALARELLRQDGVPSFTGVSRNTMPLRQIRQLLGHLCSVERDAAIFLHDLLMSIVHPDSRAKYPQLHGVASVVYAEYRNLPGAQPSQSLLMLWLEQLTKYGDKLRVLRHSPNSVSIADLVREWEKYYENLSKDAVKHLMTFYARSGRLDSYEWWLEYLRSVYSDYNDQKDILWTMIWIHAKRADLDRAQQAFAEVKRTTAEHGEEPDIVCWNLLLLAHSRVDDLEGAFTNLQNLIKHGKLKPDAHSFHSVLQMLGKRGDVSGVEVLLQQYDSLVEERRETAHLGSLLLAHVKSNNVQRAETTLQEAIPRVRRREIRGPLVGCFNIILTAHAMSRDIDSATRTYRWMKNEGIQPDANSYAAVMQALIFYRRTQEASGILKRVMPANEIRPTAFHYAILIAGYVNNGQPNSAIDMYNQMIQMNVKPSINARRAYLKAKAITEHRWTRRRKLPNNEPVALEETIKELKRFMRMSDGSEIALKQPGLGFGSGTINLVDAVPAAYFDFLIFIHGQRRCFDAVKSLYQEYKENVKKHGKDSDITPIRLLGSFAAACWRYGQYEDVEQCWRLAKEQADESASLVEAPDLISPRANNHSGNDASELDSPASASQDLGESKTQQGAESDDSEDVAKQLPSSPHKQAPHLRPPAPGHRHILTRVLRYYLLSLHSQGRTADAISTVTQIINQGYTMDNRTWNTFIESLCRTTPPLALLAYVLAERFLTPHFPGWSPAVAYPPTTGAVVEGLQYIKARHLSPGQLMPRYRTFVWLGRALLQLKQSLAVAGGSSNHAIQPELKKYIGTVSLLRRHAPKTLFYVQSMPKVPDKLQSQVLRRGGA